MAEHEPVAWIDTTSFEDASGELRELYGAVVDPVSGELDNIMRIHSANPPGLAAHYALYRAVMTATPTLRGADREMIALLVSSINDCHY
ncbi:MAG: alkylhydroperoxidase family enzyme [Planctomycetota bacterium]|jgi:alkylhydroperoxidase family enzyme